MWGAAIPGCWSVCPKASLLMASSRAKVFSALFKGGRRHSTGTCCEIIGEICDCSCSPCLGCLGGAAGVPKVPGALEKVVKSSTASARSMRITLNIYDRYQLCNIPTALHSQQRHCRLLHTHEPLEPPARAVMMHLTSLGRRACGIGWPVVRHVQARTLSQLAPPAGGRPVAAAAAGRWRRSPHTREPAWVARSASSPQAQHEMLQEGQPLPTAAIGQVGSNDGGLRGAHAAPCTWGSMRLLCTCRPPDAFAPQQASHPRGVLQATVQARQVQAGHVDCQHIPSFAFSCPVAPAT